MNKVDDLQQEKVAAVRRWCELPSRGVVLLEARMGKGAYTGHGSYVHSMPGEQSAGLF